MRYFMQMAYSGLNYHGYQIQPESDTVQARIEHCLSTLLACQVAITGCGRTDTGVSARCYYAHFDVEKEIENTNELCRKLNSFLPIDIVVYRIWPVDGDVHARFDAKSRTYHYYITKQKNPFHISDAYFLPVELDVELMQEAATALKEYTDFTSFSKLHTQVKTNNCVIYDACWYCREDSILVFSITADRFLRNMVRAIVGTLIEVGRGNMSLHDFRKVIEARDRSKAGFSVPAHALFLENVTYGDDFEMKRGKPSQLGDTLKHKT